ncbi:MAG: hypothetical protein KJZ78_06440, partial [Bryobacteraceae bacterium]|nr:hypothetical protein [Bryobacteraceae bacterium]
GRVAFAIRSATGGPSGTASRIYRRTKCSGDIRKFSRSDSIASSFRDSFCHAFGDAAVVEDA